MEKRQIPEEGFYLCTFRISSHFSCREKERKKSVIRRERGGGGGLIFNSAFTASFRDARLSQARAGGSIFVTDWEAM